VVHETRAVYYQEYRIPVREMWRPTNVISGSMTSIKSSSVLHRGMRSAQNGKKYTKFAVLVPGGVGAYSVSIGLRTGAGITPVAPQ
jgi:hypothetical protein